MKPLALDQADDSTAWRIINDEVMGGCSASSFARSASSKIFRGTLKADHGGGFASIRRDVSIPPGFSANAIDAVLRGDAKQYQFRVRNAASLDGSAYRFDFVAPVRWTKISMPLVDFQATRRGQPLAGMAPIVADEILQIGFLISAKQFGDFQLEIGDIHLVTI